jgi:hypothetical protein
MYAHADSCDSPLFRSSEPSLHSFTSLSFAQTCQDMSSKAFTTESVLVCIHWLFLSSQEADAFLVVTGGRSSRGDQPARSRDSERAGSGDGPENAAGHRRAPAGDCAGASHASRGRGAIILSFSSSLIIQLLSDGCEASGGQCRASAGDCARMTQVKKEATS